LLFVVWAGAIWHGRTQLARWTQGNEFRDGDTLFIRAQTEYLQGHWYEAESLLQELAERHHRDAECRLMLASLYRRTKRYEESRDLLDQLDLMETADRWALERSRERRLLEDAEPDDTTDVEGVAGVEEVVK